MNDGSDDIDVDGQGDGGRHQHTGRVPSREDVVRVAGGDGHVTSLQVNRGQFIIHTQLWNSEVKWASGVSELSPLSKQKSLQRLRGGWPLNPAEWITHLPEHDQPANWGLVLLNIS